MNITTNGKYLILHIVKNTLRCIGDVYIKNIIIITRVFFFFFFAFIISINVEVEIIEITYLNNDDAIHENNRLVNMRFSVLLYFIAA